MRNTPTPLALVAALLFTSACRHDVAPPEDGHTAVFVAEGGELIDQLEDEDGFGVSPLVAVREGSTRVGLRYDANGPVDADVRVSFDGGATVTDWLPTTLTFSEEGANNARVDLDASDATHVQVRFRAPVESGLAFLAVDTFVPESEAEDTGPVSQALAADGIALSRASWGARTRNCNSASAPARITIHHTETPSNDSLGVPARLRQIQNYHIDVRGWCDIGYHFLVARDGNVYQGRRENTLGAHVAGANTGNVGVAFVGSFMSAAPSAAMQSAAARVLGALARDYGITLNRTQVKGHRERGSTACPGDALYARLGALLDEAVGVAAPEAPDAEQPGGDPPGACDVVRVVNASNLNVRPEPNTDRTPLGTLAEGEAVAVLGIVTNGQSVLGTRTWYRIEDAGLTGYISGAYAVCE